MSQKNKWLTLHATKDEPRFEVMPVGDSRPHVKITGLWIKKTCPCGPATREFPQAAGVVGIIHNSFDGRGAWEQAAKRRPS